MSFVKDLWGWLTRPRQRGARKGHPDLNPYDVKKLVDELNLRAEARRLGEAGIPAPDAVRPSGAESEAIQRVDRFRQDYVDWSATRLTVLNEQLAKSDITQLVNRARLADQEFERTASSLLTEQEPVLRATGEKARELGLELAAFRDRHQLTRRATYPSGPRAFLGYAVLACLVIVEGLLNSAFFAQGLDSGLIGGAAHAMALAALNVAVAYGMGRWPCRYIHHMRAGHKVRGWAALILAVGFMVVVGLAIAHFRDELILGNANPASAALQELLRTPWSLNDLVSWGLLGISIVFASIAFFDGMFSDDLYPGYGSVSRRAEDARADYDEQLQHVRSELDEIRQQKLGLLDSAAKSAIASVARFETTIGDKKTTKLKLERALRDAENSLAAVLSIFRQENELARKGFPRPAYFDEPTQLAPLTAPDFDTSADEKRLKDQRALGDELTAELQQIRARIEAALVHKFDLLKPLQQHFDTAGDKA